MANLPSVEDLLAAGSHFGHQTQRWNPKMKPYILAEKNGIYVLNLSKTRDLLEEAGKAAAKISESGKTVLFVGTKPTARQVVLDAAAACKHFSVTNRWLGGMLTNFQTVRKSIKQIDKIDTMEQDGTFQALSKKEVLDKNPGLRSRIAYHVPFADYNDDELCEIATYQADKKGLSLSGDAYDKLRQVFARERQAADFGNGRVVRNVLEKARMAQAERLLAMDYDSVGPEDVTTIRGEDIALPEEPRGQKKALGFSVA